jgi:hypothetical protein
MMIGLQAIEQLQTRRLPRFIPPQRKLSTHDVSNRVERINVTDEYLEAEDY